MSNKILYIIRGVSGSGKTEFAESLGCEMVAADDFFMEGEQYVFDASLLSDAHEACQMAVAVYMGQGVPKIAVHNTFTTEKEIRPYQGLAARYGYQVFCLVVENRHGGRSVHEVPEEVLTRQENRLRSSIRLR